MYHRETLQAVGDPPLPVFRAAPTHVQQRGPSVSLRQEVPAPGVLQIRKLALSPRVETVCWS